MNNLAFYGEENTFTNADISAESFVLDEVLCSTGALSFGACEANAMKVQIRHTEPVIGQEFRVTFNEEELGFFTVVEDRPTANRCYRNLVLADRLYFIVNTDMTGWYKSLQFPMTLKDFRDAFFAHFDVEQEDAALPIDDLVLNKIEAIEAISGQKIITDICMLAGCFGNMGRDGRFCYVYLENLLVPSEELYPSEDLYPGSLRFDADYKRSQYSACVYQDYDVEPITGVVILDNQNKTAAVVGTSENVYQVVDNFLLYGKTSAECAQVAEVLLSVISGEVFTPVDLTAVGLLDLQLGDSIKVYIEGGELNSFVLQHTLSGIQSLHDNIVADCTQYVEDRPNTLAAAIRYIKAAQTEQALRVGDLEADNATIHGSLRAQSADIEEIRTKKLDADQLSAEVAKLGYATVQALDATNATVRGKLNANELSSAITAIDRVTIGGYLQIGVYLAQWQSVTVKDAAGNDVTINYLGHA